MAGARCRLAGFPGDGRLFGRVHCRHQGHRRRRDGGAAGDRWAGLGPLRRREHGRQPFVHGAFLGHVLLARQQLRTGRHSQPRPVLRRHRAGLLRRARMADAGRGPHRHGRVYLGRLPPGGADRRIRAEGPGQFRPRIPAVQRRRGRRLLHVRLRGRPARHAFRKPVPAALRRRSRARAPAAEAARGPRQGRAAQGVRRHRQRLRRPAANHDIDRSAAARRGAARTPGQRALGRGHRDRARRADLPLRSRPGDRRRPRADRRRHVQQAGRMACSAPSPCGRPARTPSA